MNLNERTKAFIELGNLIEYDLKTQSDDFQHIMRLAETKNKWFTKENVELSLKAYRNWLKEDALVDWLSNYHDSVDWSDKNNRAIGVIMAGNIPMVGFHDALAVLISGFKLKAKLSTDDQIMMQYLLNSLIKVDDSFKNRIEIASGALSNFSGIIATGSNNTSRYFEQYFSKYPNIIRKNRRSIAVLTGGESNDDLLELGADVFQYFGLGCRNVSQLLVPDNYNFDSFFQTMMKFDAVGQNSKYVNNVDYHKALLLVNREPFLDGGTLLVKKDESLNAPVGVLNYSTYSNDKELEQIIKSKQEEIQCVVGLSDQFVDFGKAQSPGLMDYPDGVDLIKFLGAV